MKKLYTIFLFLLSISIVSAQTPFVCDGSFYLSLGSGGTNTTFYEVTVDNGACTGTQQVTIGIFTPTAINAGSDQSSAPMVRVLAQYHPYPNEALPISPDQGENRRLQ